jgi:hypothetical protein
MALVNKSKKRVVVSYKNLTPELQEEIKKQYPNGYTDSMLRVDKGPGDFFYAIMLETEEVSYLVKVDVKVDDQVEDEDDKDYYSDEIKETMMIKSSQKRWKTTNSNLNL